MEKDEENPWNIQSLYDLQFFNCPSCEFKIHSRQDFVDHAYNSHEECMEFLPKIKDDSLDGLICPWTSIEEEIKAEDFFDESDIPTNLEDDQTQSVGESKIQCKPCGLYFSSHNSLKNHQDSSHISISIPEKSDKNEVIQKLESICKKKKVERINELEKSGDESLEEDEEKSTPISLSIPEKSDKDEVIQELVRITYKPREILNPESITKSAKTQKIEIISDKTIASKVPKKPIKSGNGVPYCEKCSMYFVSQDTLQRHLDNNHALNIVPEEKETCNVCDKEFKPKNGQSAVELLKKHKEFKHDLQCKFCDKFQFKNRNLLERHIDKEHTEKICTLCNITFKKEAYLRTDYLLNPFLRRKKRYFWLFQIFFI